MKNKKPDRRAMIRLVALILCILLAGTTIIGTLISIGYAQEAPGNHTELTWTMDEGAQGMRAFQITRYVNATGAPLNQVMFFVGANSYRRQDSAPFDEGQWMQAYPEGFNVGGVQIDGVQVDGQDAAWGVQGAGETFLRVECQLAPGQSAQFAFAYQVLLPSAQGALGAGAMGWRLGYCALLPCAWEGDFRLVDLKGMGDSACYEKQDFVVHVDAPDTYLVASGGAQQRRSADGRALTTVTLNDASNPGLALGRRYTLYEDACQGVTLRCYANTASGAKRALDAAKKVISAYMEGLGGCPVEQLSIVQADGVGDVAAFDGLLMVDKALFALGKGGPLEKALAQGLAKQWFGLAVRTDPDREPWLSDGLCAYAALLYYEKAYGHDRFLKELNGEVLDALNVTLPGGLTPDAQRSQFATSATYDMIVKARGAAVLHELRNITGEAGMWATLRGYYQDNRGALAHRAQFEAALERATGRDLRQALNSHFLSISDYVNQRVEWID